MDRRSVRRTRPPAAARRREHVEHLLGEFDRFAERVRAADPPWVITHGEPHPGTVIRTPAGPHLIDWHTVALAPPERTSGCYVDDLRRPHRTTEDSTAALTHLTGYLG